MICRIKKQYYVTPKILCQRQRLYLFVRINRLGCEDRRRLLNHDFIHIHLVTQDLNLNYCVDLVRVVSKGTLLFAIPWECSHKRSSWIYDTFIGTRRRFQDCDNVALNSKKWGGRWGKVFPSLARQRSVRWWPSFDSRKILCAWIIVLYEVQRHHNVAKETSSQCSTNLFPLRA